jgi:hypothetical protein
LRVRILGVFWQAAFLSACVIVVVGMRAEEYLAEFFDVIVRDGRVRVHARELGFILSYAFVVGGGSGCVVVYAGGLTIGIWHDAGTAWVAERVTRGVFDCACKHCA